MSTTEMFELAMCTNCGASYGVAEGVPETVHCPLCGETKHIAEHERVAGPDEWVRIDDDNDEFGRDLPIYEGPAGDAKNALMPGRYSAVTRFGRACTVQVGRE